MTNHGIPPTNPCFYFPNLTHFFVSPGAAGGALLAPYCERFPQLLPVVETLRPKGPEPSEAKKEEVPRGPMGLGSSITGWWFATMEFCNFPYIYIHMIIHIYIYNQYSYKIINIWGVYNQYMIFFTFHILIFGNVHPNWRTPSFFRGVGIPPTR